MRLAQGDAESVSRLRTHPGWRDWRLHDDARWCDRLSRRDVFFVEEEAKHTPIGPGRARGKKPAPSLLPKLFTDVLTRRPSSAAWPRQCEADARESARITEIGHLEPSSSVTPHISWELLHRRYASFREVAIPLRPEGLLVVSEVERVDDIAPLPAAVAWWLRPKAWISAVRDLTQPRTCRVDRIDIECQSAGPQTAPGDSSSDTTRATRRALPRAINSSGFRSSSASIGLDSHMGM
jgi:hypothetical protein